MDIVPRVQMLQDGQPPPQHFPVPSAMDAGVRTLALPEHLPPDTRTPKIYHRGHLSPPTTVMVLWLEIGDEYVLGFA